MVVSSGYDAGECSKIFLALQQELRDEKEEEPFFFGTHPALQARIESFRRLAGPAPRRGAGVDRAAFLSRTLQLVYDAATLDLRRGRMVAARRSADRLVAHDPASSKGAFLQGEIARQSQSLDEAVLQYRKAIELDERFPQPYRALGLLLMKRGEKPAARAALARYLELSPAADDRAYVERDLEMLR